MKKIIFDLDGTLANNKHRAVHADNKDWRTYFSLCHLDTPIPHVIDMLSSLDDRMGHVLKFGPRGQMKSVPVQKHGCSNIARTG